MSEENIFENERFSFRLETVKKEETEHAEAGKEDVTFTVTTARILREDKKEHSTLTLMEYTWPKQLRADISVQEVGKITENGELHFSLHLAVHHISGMEQGEFTEEQDYTVLEPFGEDIVCAVEDIRRKTRFALGERHLEHLPHRTYPPVDGKQGPYGHPQVRSLPPIKKKPHTQA